MTMSGLNACEIDTQQCSKTLIVITAILALFTENFLYGSVVPLLPSMIEERLQLDPSQTQRLTAQILLIPGLVALPAAPVIGHFADQRGERQRPLLLMLIICSIGVALVAFATSSQLLGLANSVITSGVITGPAISGFALQWLGYWWAWIVPGALLAMCFLVRILAKDEKNDVQLLAKTPDEHDSLLRDDQTAQKEQWTPGFYTVMLAQAPVYAAMLNIMASAMILSGFDTVLPLHLRSTFSWKPGMIGSIFLALQVPSLCLGPLVGWLRDHHGLQWPTALGWMMLAPLLCSIGVPKPSVISSSVNSMPCEQKAFIGCIIGIGMVSTLVRGAGVLQVTSIADRIRHEHPGLLGHGNGKYRVFTLTEMSFNIGLLMGPTICGSLAEQHGFQCTCYALAAISFCTGIMTWIYFTRALLY
ncbi:hypothetical protein Q7P37_006561 [Cladosporium fusiforme]